MSAGRVLKWLLITTVAMAAVALGVLSYQALSGPPLQPWHTFVPQELRVDELDASDWTRYLAQEQAIFESVRANVDMASLCQAVARISLRPQW